LGDWKKWGGGCPAEAPKRGQVWRAKGQGADSLDQARDPGPIFGEREPQANCEGPMGT